jgi:hypothetical protein
MESNLTAVEWLEEQIVVRRNGLDNSIPLKELFEQAKKIEKSQIINAFKSGDCNGTFETINAEQYYNDKFNK